VAATLDTLGGEGFSLSEQWLGSGLFGAFGGFFANLGKNLLSRVIISGVGDAECGLRKERALAEMLSLGGLFCGFVEPGSRKALMCRFPMEKVDKLDIHEPEK
jgi:hypothetical protein